MTKSFYGAGRKYRLSMGHGRAFTLSALVFSTSHAFAQIAAQTQTSTDATANQQVLQSWQVQTGQAGTVNAQGQVEFHGDATLDVYRNSVTSPSGNTALTPLRTGTFEKIVLQGDLRSTSAEEDVTYAQGVMTGSNDRSVLARYAGIINSVQIGRAGAGYQLAFGDVVASFSGLSSNLGLRGATGTKELGALTVTGFAGTVAESWEALTQRNALDGLAPRTRYLRDVVGAKADYKVTNELSGFVTFQNYRDRSGSADLQSGGAALGGTIASFGSKYVQGNFQVTAEVARSTRQDHVASLDVAGNAAVIDATYRLDSVAFRSGYHDLGANFASLAQTSTSGIREWYAGADWTINPQWSYGIDVRDAITRVAAVGESPASQSSLQYLTNRISYNVLDVPGLMLSVSDTRNKGKDALLNRTVNDTTQFVVAYGSGDWSANVLIGMGHARNPANAQADSNNRNWQVSVGRNLSNAEAEKPTDWTLNLQGTAGGQVQSLITAGTETRSSNVGLNLSATSQVYGNLNFSWQHLRTTQPVVGAPNLTTDVLNLDWTKTFGPQWTMKTFARINRRNHGDALLQVDERIIGVQGVFKW